MKPEIDQDELKALAEELSVGEEQARTMLSEIYEGEERLIAAGEPALPKGMLERIEKACRSRRQKPRVRFGWFYRAAAVIAFAVVGVWIYQIVTNVPIQYPEKSETYAMDIYSDEVDLWDVALTQEDEIDLGFDETAMTEILLLWDDAGWDTDTFLHKETHNEDNGFSAICRRGVRTA
jgi:hypothetical protein